MSGEIAQLSDSQLELVNRALTFYSHVAPLIRDGRVRRFGPEVKSYRNATGWQAVQFQRENEILVVVHSFAEAGEIEVPLPPGAWKGSDDFSDKARAVSSENGTLKLELGEWSGWPRPRNCEPLIYRLQLAVGAVAQVLSASVRVAGSL